MKIEILAFVFGILFLGGLVSAGNVCTVYFTGVGCPHCAKTDPVVLVDMLEKYPNFTVIEYEIYQQASNANLLYEFDSKYGTGFGIPLILFEKNNHITGDNPIINSIEKYVNSYENNPCPVLGGSQEIKNLKISYLSGNPKIWKEDRILIHDGGGGDDEVLRSLLLSENLSPILSSVVSKNIEPSPVPLSGRLVEFDNAVEIGGWVFQWNGEYIDSDLSGQREVNNKTNENLENSDLKELTIAKIISLGAVDAVNPCALAVLTLMMIAIISYNPKSKKNILFAGVSFITSVFILYLFYGIVIVRFFQVVQALTSVRLLLYKILGGVAIILGVLQMKDYFFYKPGGFGTEMPMSMRPKVKQIISGITGPKGAFLIGAFVTVFLLPCTIGPYVIAGGVLSAFELITAIPWLVLYNFIFVLPMIVIVLFVYRGLSEVDDVKEWKEDNIKYLHLIAGAIMFVLGIAMVLGLV